MQANSRMLTPVIIRLRRLLRQRRDGPPRSRPRRTPSQQGARDRGAAPSRSTTPRARSARLQRRERSLDASASNPRRSRSRGSPRRRSRAPASAAARPAASRARRRRTRAAASARRAPRRAPAVVERPRGAGARSRELGSREPVARAGAPERRREGRPASPRLRRPVAAAARRAYPPRPSSAASCRTPSARRQEPRRDDLVGGRPAAWIRARIPCVTSGCSRRNAVAFWRPWPSRSSPKLKYEPDFWTTLRSSAASRTVPSQEIPVPVHDVELGLLERRRDLVLDDLHADAVADRLDAVLERLDPPDVEPDRGVELQRAAAGRRLGVAEHDADLLAQLVREDADRVGAVERAGELAQRLAHQPRLEADVAVAHLALDLRLRHERGDRVDRDDVQRAASGSSSSVISSACSPVSGCETSSSSMLTPIRFAYVGSIACSASMKAQIPPRRCASAITW